MSFAVYKSSAGSGKTYNLVKEYLKLIIQKPSEFKRILAITFTNKAAGEMKSRIIETLLQIIDLEKLSDKEQERTNALINDLNADLKIEISILRSNAKKAIELILHNYSDFAVSTIDSFIYGIVRTFAKDLNIPLNFDVELEQDALLEQAIDILISRVGTDEDITKMLVRFIESQVEDQKNLKIEDEIKNIGTYLFREESISKIESLKTIKLSDFFKIQEKIFIFTQQYKKKLKIEAENALDLINRHAISPEAFYYKKNGIATYFKNIASGQIEKIENKNIAKGVENDKWTSDFCTKEEAIAINLIKSNLSAHYYNIHEIVEKEGEKAHLYFLMARNVFTLAVLTEIADIIDNIKKENNIVHISEFNKKIADIVLKEPVPFVYERTGVKFGHIMIDEFQDTSILQWLNLLPLLENALAEGGFTMVVGDGKQAIYRWRDGEVEQFVKLPSIHSKHLGIDFDKKEKTLQQHCEVVELQKNFRSYKTIIDFNNDFFTKASTQLPEDYKAIYKTVIQQSDNKKMGGYVEIHFADKNPDISFEEFNLEKTIHIINDLIDNKNYKAADITVLCRSNKNANAVARYLIENNINVVSSESLLLYKSPLVNFVLSLLEYLNDNNNTIAEIKIINYLHKINALNNLSFSTLLSNVTNDKKYLNTQLRYSFSDFDYYKLKNLPLYDICEELIRIFSLNKKPDAYLQFFMDVIFNFTTSKKNNIPDFLSYWEDNAETFSVVVPQGIDAVRVMTIHKSKGLQFPVVIYPFANERRKLSKKNFWIDVNDGLFPELNTFLIPATEGVKETIYKDLYVEEDNKSTLDLMNILYVTLTRPVEKLFIISEVPGKTSQTLSVNSLLKSYLAENNLWNDNLRTYSFGENTCTVKNNETENLQTFKFDSFISSKWQNMLVMKYKAKDIWHLESVNEALRWGNLIHDAMCRIITASDVDTTLNCMCLEGYFDVSETNFIKEKINSLILHPSIKDFYNAGHEVLNEREIMDKEGKIYRPDRIVIANKKTALIDYKTGQENEKHKTQVNKYADLLSEMGYNGIEKHLVYIDKDVVISW